MLPTSIVINASFVRKIVPMYVKCLVEYLGRMNDQIFNAD